MASLSFNSHHVLAGDSCRTATANTLLAALPEDSYRRLMPYLSHVELPQGKIIFQPGERIEEVYFPKRAMISLVALMSDGSSTEVSLVGHEGMIGLPALLGTQSSSHQAIVQIPHRDGACVVGSDVLQAEFDRSDAVRQIFLTYVQSRLVQVGQTAACNRRHTVEVRLARWLLTAQDRTGSDVLPLTHELIATMLGIRRAGVTVAAGHLQKAGLISYGRGEVTIVDRAGLEARVCECYSIVRSEYERIFQLQQKVSERF